jgi:CheY-like chemotaxis protein
LDGVRVLAVDDDPRILDALQVLLHAAGAVVAVARAAATAYSILEEGEIDIVLSDITMTVEDGYSLMRRVRAAPSQLMRSVPAIAISGRIVDDNQQRALEAGFDLYLTKPIDVPNLITVMAQLVSDSYLRTR